jgi:GT2 family glycosyltransferase
MSTDLSVTVIVPVYNGRATLAGCLQALYTQTCPPAEIIVVDDGSTDDTAAIAAGMGVTVITQRRAGPAAARNRGARAARSPLLLFTDADCAPALDWVERLAAPFTDPTVAGAKGKYNTRQPGLTPRFVQQEYQDRYDRMVGQPSIDFIDTYAAAYRRDLFISNGGFDPVYPTASVEDQDFSFRLAAQGHRLVYVPDAVVYHLHNHTITTYARRKFWIGYWKALVMRRYPAKLAYDSHTPQRLKIQLLLAALGTIFLLTGFIAPEPLLWLAAAVSWSGLVVSGMSLYEKILWRDPPVIVIAPLMVFIRAMALGLGFGLGLLRFGLMPAAKPLPPAPTPGGGE